MKKRAGVLLPIFSLPGKYGIGTLGREAMEFIDLLAETGNSIWQILPMGPTGFGDSPYQAFSAFAGNPYFINLEALAEEGLLRQEVLDSIDFGADENAVDYEKIYFGRQKALTEAYETWLGQGHQTAELLQALRPETREYCEFMAIKNAQGGASWNVWPEALRDRKPEALEAFRAEHAQEIGLYAFLQTIFMKQWKKIRDYAGKKEVEILGDIPIYCAPDSADAWAHRELFQFDSKGFPLRIAGVPPDAFSATGQLWGNPLYDWKQHEKTGFAWWIHRMEYCFELYDSLRVDHFRGFEAYYAVPYGEETAEKGEWVTGPGMKLFNAMYQYFGTRELPIIAEDLGVITDQVRELMEETGFPGMKVLQFAWDSGPENTYLPHNYTTPNCICYTGTHDNDTLRHWFETIPDWQREYMYLYMSRSANDWNAMPELLIKRAMASIAGTVIVPAADYLNLGGEGRINQPGTSGANWKWRLQRDAFNDNVRAVMARIAGIYGRYQQRKTEEETPEEAQEDTLKETLKEITE